MSIMQLVCPWLGTRIPMSAQATWMLHRVLWQVETNSVPSQSNPIAREHYVSVRAVFAGHISSIRRQIVYDKAKPWLHHRNGAHPMAEARGLRAEIGQLRVCGSKQNETQHQGHKVGGALAGAQCVDQVEPRPKRTIEHVGPDIGLDRHAVASQFDIG